MIRRLFALIRADFKLEFAYPLSVVFFLVLPLVFTGAVGAGLSGMLGSDGEPQEYQTRIFIIDHDQGPLVDPLLDALIEVNLAPELVDILPEESFGLEIPPGFSEQLLKGEQTTIQLHTRPTITASQAVEQYVQGAISRIGGAALVAEMGLAQAREAALITDEEDALVLFNDIFEDTLASSQNPPAVSRVRWSGGDQQEDIPDREIATSAEQASAGQLVTWVQITLLGAAEVFVSERLGGTMRRLLVSPTSRATILGGKLLSRLLLGLVQMTILFVGGTYLFRVNWGRDPLALIVISVSFALAIVGLGMFVATFLKTRSQSGNLVVGLAMGMSALGGAWYPLEITPPLYQQIVQILPSTWAMRAYTDLLARGAGVVNILPAAGVLMIFAAVFISLGVLRFRRYQ